MNLIGIFSKNRLEWYVTDWACSLFGYTVCPLYDTLGKDNLEYCIELCGLTTLFVSGKTAAALSSFEQKGSLKTIVCFDDLDADLKEKLTKQGLEVLDYWQLIEEGIKSETTNKDIVVKPEDIYTFCYTSGTTGRPKGALISHSNMMASTSGFLRHKDLAFSDDDVYLSTLPLPHIMERSIAMGMFHIGAFLV
jgi:long-chain acyl-CoA synthetase